MVNQGLIFFAFVSQKYNWVMVLKMKGQKSYNCVCGDKVEVRNVASSLLFSSWCLACSAY